MSKYDFRILQHLKHLRFCCLVLFGALHSFQVTAQIALDQSAYDRFMWSVTGGNQQTVNYGGNGQVVVTPAGAPMPVERAGTTSGSDVGYSGSASKTNPSGNKVPIGVSAKVLGSAAAKIIGAGLGVSAIVGTGQALWDLCNELGFNCSKTAGGPLTITKPDPTICTTAPCYQYLVNAAVGDPPQRIQASSHKAACTLWAQHPSRGSYKSNYIASNESTCYLTDWTDYPYQMGITKVEVSPGAPVPSPSTLAELQDFISARTTGWPLNSAIHKAIEEAAKATGQKVPLTNPKVSGPATSQGTTKTTVDPAKNTTTTTGVTHNHTYNDNRVTTTTTTSSNVTNNTTGTGETTTTTEEPVEEESECQKNPQSIGCAELDTPEGEIPRVEKLITFTPENLGFGGGSCPANVVQNLGGSPVTIVNWTQNCSYITTYAKPIILALASFSALMIIFVGGKPE